MTPIRRNTAVRIHPNSFAFTLLLGLLASLPTFGIDMILPGLSATAADLGATSADVGLAMSVYLMSMGAALLVYGPISDLLGRKPIVVFGCALVVVASLGCLLSVSLPQLLFFRALQGAGASATGIAAVAIVNDLFEGEAAGAKMANVVLAIYIVPMIAPTVGAALLALGSWRTIYLVPTAGGLVLLVAMFGFSESATIDPKLQLSHATILRNYLRVLRHPLCVGYILCNAAAAGAMFAYVAGSSLFFINGLGLNPYQFGVIFGASSLSVMLGTRVNRILGRLGLSPAPVILARPRTLDLPGHVPGHHDARGRQIGCSGGDRDRRRRIVIRLSLASYHERSGAADAGNRGDHHCRESVRANGWRRVVHRNGRCALRRAFGIFDGCGDAWLLLVGIRHLCWRRSSGRTSRLRCLNANQVREEGP
ncbi:MFS transporter [Bradyrhizobium sp. JR3.5]